MGVHQATLLIPMVQMHPIRDQWYILNRRQRYRFSNFHPLQPIHHFFFDRRFYDNVGQLAIVQGGFPEMSYFGSKHVILGHYWPKKVDFGQFLAIFSHFRTFS